jgi:serine protease AprX
VPAPQPDQLIWVFFRDKGPGTGEALSGDALLRRVALSPRALERRARRAPGAPFDQTDLPVYAPYVEQVRSQVTRVRTVSRWLNGVSARATPEERDRIERLAFVREVTPVVVDRRPLPDIVEPARGTGAPSLGRLPPAGASTTAPALDYGAGASQIFLISADYLHQAGINGSGIVVCMLDTGFRTDHEALGHLQLLAQYDFVNSDEVTSNEPGDPSNQQNHGTFTLGAMAAYKEGEVIGPAYGAQFLLAKTEIVDQEIQLEEDLWVTGLEWADSAGADVVSSSLGYYDWYTYEDMNGDTAVTTRAADLAAAKGMVVVVAAGNRSSAWGAGNGGLIAPADGDSVVTVGAVDDLGQIASFSSRGPTFDGRIKPEVCAMGVLTRTVAVNDTTGYAQVSGTSLSTPLVAGVCAQLLQIHPEWSPMDVREALIQTADRASSPDNVYGYGVANAFAAANFESTGIGTTPPPIPTFSLRGLPNPFRPSLHGEIVVEYDLDHRDEISLRVYDVGGRLVRTLREGLFLYPGHVHRAKWDGLDDRGDRVASGLYFLRLETSRGSHARKILLID